MVNECLVLFLTTDGIQEADNVTRQWELTRDT